MGAGASAEASAALAKATDAELADALKGMSPEALAKVRTVVDSAGQAAGMAVVTGAGSGIGKALAMLLAKKGVEVLAVDKSKAVQDLKADNITACLADVGTTDGIAEISKAVGDKAVQTLALNAGSLSAQPLLALDPSSMDEMIGVHFMGPIFVTQALVPNLKKGSNSRILLTAGGGADAFIPTLGGYGATKAAMKTLQLALRDECADFASVGICYPGPTKTPFWDATLADENWPLKPVFGPRLENGDCYTAEETAEWMAALMTTSTETFKERNHNIDNPEHQCGIKVTLTSEGKTFLEKKDGSSGEAKSAEAEKADEPATPSGVTAVITGAASGIGKELALLLAKSGTKVIGVDKNEKALGELKGDGITTCLADVGSVKGRDAVKAAVGDTEVHILALHAGCLAAQPVLGIDRSSMDAMVDAHMRSPILLTSGLQSNLKKAGNARVLLTCGGGHDAHIPTLGGYGATKAGMKTIALYLRNECADFAAVGICFPGPTKTPFWDVTLADENWPLKAVFGPRLENGDCYTAQEVAEWMAALLNPSTCNTPSFKEREHNIDNPKHQCGVKVTLTTEGKGFSAE